MNASLQIKRCPHCNADNEIDAAACWACNNGLALAPDSESLGGGGPGKGENASPKEATDNDEALRQEPRQ